MIKFLEKYKWYRIKHLEHYIPNEYKDAYEKIQMGIPIPLCQVLAVCKIVENIKEGKI